MGAFAEGLNLLQTLTTTRKELHMATKKAIPELSESDKERFLPRIPKGAPDECWPWSGNRNVGGYGTFDYARGIFITTRVMWRLTFGVDPGVLNVLHSCDNPPCCNPAHLWLGTHSENTRDMIAKGRRNHARGDRNGSRTHPEKVHRGVSHKLAKLTDDAVREIRATIGVTTLNEMAAKFGVDFTLISLVRRGKAWKHVI